MKTSKLLTASFILLGILISGNILAQTDYTSVNNEQTVRNTSLINYSIENTDATSAIFEWTVTGGIIVVGGADQGTTYTTPTAIANGASSVISVRWDNTNKTTVNSGSLSVRKSLGGCWGTPLAITVYSWVAPNVTAVTTSTPSICSGSAPTIGLTLQGCPLNSGFSYNWEIRDASNVVVDSGTGTSTNASVASVPSISNRSNSTGTNQTYTFVVTSLLDGLSGAAVTSFTQSSVSFTVNAVPTIGTINSSSSLTPR